MRRALAFNALSKWKLLDSILNMLGRSRLCSLLSLFLFLVRLGCGTAISQFMHKNCEIKLPKNLRKKRKRKTKRNKKIHQNWRDGSAAKPVPAFAGNLSCSLAGTWQSSAMFNCSSKGSDALYRPLWAP